MDSFAEILNMPVGDVPRDAAFPAGTYLMVVNGPYQINKSGEDQKDVVDLSLKILQKKDDVDDSGFPGGVLRREYRARFFEAGPLADFLEKLGIEKGVSMREALSQAPGKQVWVSLGQRPAKDGSRMFNNIKGVATV